LIEQIFEHRAMQALLVLEIIEKHCFTCMRGGGDFVCARSGNTVRGKVLLRRGQNSPRRFRVLDFSSSSLHGLNL
jgi:hypothetical protein